MRGTRFLQKVQVHLKMQHFLAKVLNGLVKISLMVSNGFIGVGENKNCKPISGHFQGM